MENSIDIQDPSYLVNFKDLEKPNSKRYQNDSRLTMGIQDIMFIINSDAVDIDKKDIKHDLPTFQFGTECSKLQIKRLIFDFELQDVEIKNEVENDISEDPLNVEKLSKNGKPFIVSVHLHKCKKCHKYFSNDYKLNQHLAEVCPWNQNNETIQHENPQNLEESTSNQNNEEGMKQESYFCDSNEYDEKFQCFVRLKQIQESEIKKWKSADLEYQDENYSDDNYDEKDDYDDQESHDEFLSSDFEDLDIQQKSKQTKLQNFTCKICGKCFECNGHLKRHTAHIHEDQRNHKCNDCGKSFHLSSGLKRHIETVHEGLKKFNCETCGKAFAHSGSLQTHIRCVHKGEKNNKFCCKICGKFFEYECKLKKHTAHVHEGQRDHKCDQCGKYFQTSSSLKNHIERVHEGLKKYQCETCGMAFSEPDGVKRHIISVHGGERQHKCETCGKAFRYHP